MSEVNIFVCGGCGKKTRWVGIVPKGAVCLACYERNERELRR